MLAQAALLETVLRPRTPPIEPTQERVLERAPMGAPAQPTAPEVLKQPTGHPRAARGLQTAALAICHRRAADPVLPLRGHPERVVPALPRLVVEMHRRPGVQVRAERPVAAAVA